jgi:predicted secreted protein
MTAGRWVMVQQTKDKLKVDAFQEFWISREFPPGKDYSWEIEKVPEGIKLLTDVYVPEGPTAAPTPPGLCVFKFKADTKGEYTLNFLLKHGSKSQPEQRYTITVTVV